MTVMSCLYRGKLSSGGDDAVVDILSPPVFAGLTFIVIDRRRERLGDCDDARN